MEKSITFYGLFHSLLRDALHSSIYWMDKSMDFGISLCNNDITNQKEDEFYETKNTYVCHNGSPYRQPDSLRQP